MSSAWNARILVMPRAKIKYDAYAKVWMVAVYFNDPESFCRVGSTETLAGAVASFERLCAQHLDSLHGRYGYPGDSLIPPINS